MFFFNLIPNPKNYLNSITFISRAGISRKNVRVIDGNANGVGGIAILETAQQTSIAGETSVFSSKVPVTSFGSL